MEAPKPFPIKYEQPCPSTNCLQFSNRALTEKVHGKAVPELEIPLANSAAPQNDAIVLEPVILVWVGIDAVLLNVAV